MTVQGFGGQNQNVRVRVEEDPAGRWRTGRKGIEVTTRRADQSGNWVEDFGEAGGDCVVQAGEIQPQDPKGGRSGGHAGRDGQTLGRNPFAHVDVHQLSEEMNAVGPESIDEGYTARQEVV